jgi:mono/diheme cytochrome c family protein
MTWKFAVWGAAASVAACALLVDGSTIRRANAQQAPTHDPTDAGKQVFKRANCMGCHKWHGNGGGGYGGDALSLRKTQLTREQIIETVGCGRPGTGMPFHIRGAYDAEPCYGLTRAELAGTMPPEAAAFLRPPEIEAVADYLIAHVKGKGEPNYDDCIAFFGEGSRVCGIYETPQQAGGSAPSKAPKN